MDEARARRRQTDIEPSGYGSTGALLKAAREAAGLSLAEVSERTHIKQAFLDAIEQMNMAALPKQRAFVTGFVSVYAKHVGLGADEIVRRFKEETGAAQPVEIEPEKYAAAPRNEPELDRPEMSLWFALGVVAAIAWCVVLIVTTAHQRSTPYSFDPGAAARAAVVAPRPQADAAPKPAEPPAPAIVGLPAEQLSGYVEARPLERIDPVYPQRCEPSANPRETVEVAFNVSGRGVVSGARVASSSNACFNDAALNAIRRWTFEPRQVESKARPAYDLRYTFRFDRPN
ncbi:MAG: TonB family protein [Parvularculaceae bacterium]|nr:TonB family protein [Parvularculaceae bacterium]